MNVENTIKKTDLGKRGFFALIHDDTGKIYATTAVNIHKELSELIEMLRQKTCPNVKLQKLYDASANFQVVTAISKDGMKGAKKDYWNFRGLTSSYLFI